MRGEYYEPGQPDRTVQELPPRARRIQRREGLLAFHGGTTSACAENTALLIVAVVLTGNYLRVRGEYLLIIPIGKLLRELPPRARRILNIFLNICTELGTTSACAENTLRISQVDSRLGNYLRVRGEYRNDW